MRSLVYLPIWLALIMSMLFNVSQAQSGSSSVDTPAVPAHSGSAAGENGPQVSGPPPARQSSNPVNNGQDDSPRRTLTGVVSDSYCGRHHYMLKGANDAECTRYCIAHQRDYVLVVGDSLYTLKNRPGHVLDALAGKKAQVTGALLGGDVLEVDTVHPVEGQSR
jgi:hypothetical protein